MKLVIETDQDVRELHIVFGEKSSEVNFNPSTSNSSIKPTDFSAAKDSTTSVQTIKPSETSKKETPIDNSNIDSVTSNALDKVLSKSVTTESKAEIPDEMNIEM